MELEFGLRARIHAFELELRNRNIRGLLYLSPCIRSTMVSDLRPMHLRCDD